MLKKLLFIIWVLLLVTACHSDKKYAALPVKSNVVILGDSLTYGTGASSGEDYASLLANNTGWNLINAGIPGNTSSDGLARLPDLLNVELEQGKIDLVIVELGGNDFLRHLPEQETVNNLKTILTQIKAKNIQVVLLAIPEFSPVGAAFGKLSDHPLYEKLAKETETPLVENLFSKVLVKNNLKSDYIHPNAAGYRMVEANLRDSLIELGFLNTK